MSKVVEHIGVLTSGGDSPGMNAAIRAVVRGALYHGLRVSGIEDGFDGMIQGRIGELNSRDVSNILQRGGTILGSSRSKEFFHAEGRVIAAKNMRAVGLDALVVIGGDGTFAGALAFNEEHGTPIIGLPGTIDNDLFGSDLTIGFDTATNVALEAIDRIRDTASSHDRLFFVEVMGKDAGFIALRTAIASGAEFVMIPERHQEIDELVEAIRAGENRRSSSIVIVAEGDEEGNAVMIAKKVKAQYDHYDTRVTVLGHIQRGGAPTVTDRVLASRLGIGAVEALINGHSNKMAGLVNDEVALTPFSEAIGRTKDINSDLMRVLGILST